MSTASETVGFATPDHLRRRREGTPEPPTRPTLHQQPKLSPPTPDRASPHPKVGACFTCGQAGHWSRDCPSKNGTGGQGQLPEQVGADDGVAVGFPECPCGAGPCVTLISRTETNPGRMFFRCPVPLRDKKCRFFQWCDSPSPHRQHVTSPVQQCVNSRSPLQQQAANTPQQGNFHPQCECGAGWCHILTCEEGENTGRKYFSCPAKKSNERCPFSLWCDEPNLTGKCTARPSHRDLVGPAHGGANTQHPNCPCGAGKCRLLTMEVGEYVGRNYFACTVKKGQGACNFFRWQNPMEGETENGKNPLVGNRDHQPDLVAEEARAAKPFDIKPTFLNFDDIDVGETNAGCDEAHKSSSPLERQQGDAVGPSDRCHRPSLQTSSTSVSLKPGKCYMCDKEGHWAADCVEYLPSSYW